MKKIIVTGGNGRFGKILKELSGKIIYFPLKSNNTYKKH